MRFDLTEFPYISCALTVAVLADVTGFEVTTNVAVLAPGFTRMLAGTEIELCAVESRIENPPVGASAVSEIVAVAGLEAVTVEGVIVNPLRRTVGISTDRLAATL